MQMSWRAHGTGLVALPGRDAVDALAHGGKAEIGAVGDERGEQRAVWIRSAGFVAAERLKGVGEAAPRVDVLQHVFDRARGRLAFMVARSCRTVGGIGNASAFFSFSLPFSTAAKQLAPKPMAASRAARSSAAAILSRKARGAAGRSSRP